MGMPYLISINASQAYILQFQNLKGNYVIANKYLLCVKIYIVCLPDCLHLYIYIYIYMILKYFGAYHLSVDHTLLYYIQNHVTKISFQ